jgi:hypothetical protein
MSVNKVIKKVTTNTLQRLKVNGEKISMIRLMIFRLPGCLTVPVLM